MSAVSNSLRDSLRRALAAAIKQREAIRTAALRSALAAIDNAEAVTSPPVRGLDRSPFAGSVEGVGAGDARRRTLTEADAIRLVRQEIQTLRDSAELYDRVRRHEHAGNLRAQAGVLNEFVGTAG